MRRSAPRADLRPYVAAVIAFLTLAPSGGGTLGISPWCLTCGDRGLADLLLNVLLFVPLGAAIAARGASAQRALLLGLAFAAGIELLQLVIPGRAPTARDVITNGFGAWLGARALLAARDWTIGPRHALRRLTFVVLALGAIFAGLHWLDTPAQLRSFHWTQWRPLLGKAPRWPGQLVDVSIGDMRLAEGRLPPTHPLRDYLDADSTLHLRLIGAGPTSEWMPIVGIVDSWRVHLVLLGQDGDDLILRMGRRATYFLLETPEIRYAGALRDIPRGAEFAITLRGIASGSPCLSVAGEERCARASTPGSTWRLFLPMSARAPGAGHPFDALTLAVLLLPVGLLLRLLPRQQAVLAGGVSLLALGAWTRLLGYALPTALELLGVAAGIAAGAWITRWFAPRDSGNVADDARPEQLREGHR